MSAPIGVMVVERSTSRSVAGNDVVDGVGQDTDGLGIAVTATAIGPTSYVLWHKRARTVVAQWVAVVNAVRYWKKKCMRRQRMSTR